MFRGHSRPLGVLLLAVLAVTPVVRALCAVECRAERPAQTSAPESPEHCTRPTVDRDPPTLELTGVLGCTGCDSTSGAVQATLRTDVKAPAAGLVLVIASFPPDEFVAAAVAASIPLSGSPPLRAPYPLRI